MELVANVRAGRVDCIVSRNCCSCRRLHGTCAGILCAQIREQIIESAVSSNRIEGVSVEPSRIQSVLVAAKPLFRDRDEEEIRGYRDALAWIHENAASIRLNEKTLERMHAMARGQIWDAGQYKEKDGDIIERYADGRERVRFEPTSAADTPAAMERLIEVWKQCADASGDARLALGRTALDVSRPVFACACAVHATGIAAFALCATRFVFSAAHRVVGAMKQSIEVATSAMRKQIPGAGIPEAL